MVQIKLSVVFLIAAAAIAHVVALPLVESSESVQPATVDSNQNPIPDTPQAASDHIAVDETVVHPGGDPRVLRGGGGGGRGGGRGGGKG